VKEAAGLAHKQKFWGKMWQDKMEKRNVGIFHHSEKSTHGTTNMEENRSAGKGLQLSFSSSDIRPLFGVVQSGDKRIRQGKYKIVVQDVDGINLSEPQR
jgi:hypothetical protein